VAAGDQAALTVPIMALVTESIERVG